MASATPLLALSMTKRARTTKNAFAVFTEERVTMMSSFFLLPLATNAIIVATADVTPGNIETIEPEAVPIPIPLLASTTSTSASFMCWGGICLSFRERRSVGIPKSPARAGKRGDAGAWMGEDKLKSKMVAPKMPERKKIAKAEVICFTLFSVTTSKIEMASKIHGIMLLRIG